MTATQSGKALFPASFDPVTNGHLDLIHRARLVFPELVVAVAKNIGKTVTFTIEERLDMMQSALGNLPGVTVTAFDGLVVDFAHEYRRARDPAGSARERRLRVRVRDGVDEMLYVQDIDAKAGKTFEIPVTKEWERHDVYITALVFRGGSAPSKITPARAVGIAHVPMDRRDRTVAVGLSVPARMRPESELPVTLSVPQLAGQQAFVTVSAVDVGILNITAFPVPDAAKHFFAQRRLGVDAYDVYGRVIESFEGGTARIRFGGDAAPLSLPQARRPTARVQTVDLFNGPVQLDAKGLAKVKLAVPDFNGTLRVSALVYSGNRYGSKAAETVVRAPLLAEASLPRVLAPGDRSSVTLDVQNFTGKAGQFKVQVEGIGPLSVSDGARTATLGVGAKTTFTFPLTAREGYTTAQVRVRVEGNGYQVDRRHDVPVRPAWSQVMRSRTKVLDELAAVQLDRDLIDGLMPGSVQARMVVSALPPIPFAAALEDALRYPYGCAEQNTSPHLVAVRGRAAEAPARPLPCAPAALTISLQVKILVSYLIVEVVLLFAIPAISSRVPSAPGAGAIVLGLTIAMGWGLTVAIAGVSREVFRATDTKLGREVALKT